MLYSCFFSYSYSASRYSYSYSYSNRSSTAIRPIGPQVAANRFDQRSAVPQFKQPSSTSTVSLSTASLSTSTTKSNASHERPHGPSARRKSHHVRVRPVEHFGPMLCSCFFSYSYSASRYSYSYSNRSSTAIRPIGPQVAANRFDQRSAAPQFKQPSSTSTVSLSTASLSTSTTKSNASHERPH